MEISRKSVENDFDFDDFLRHDSDADSHNDHDGPDGPSREHSTPTTKALNQPAFPPGTDSIRQKYVIPSPVIGITRREHIQTGFLCYVAKTLTLRHIKNSSVYTIMQNVRWLLVKGLPASACACTLSSSDVNKLRLKLENIQRAVDAIIEHGE